MAFGGPPAGSPFGGQTATASSAAAGLPFAGVPTELVDRVEDILATEPDHPAPDIHFTQIEHDEAPFTLRRFLSTRRAALLGAFALVGIETLAAQAGPLLTQRAIDNGIMAASTSVLVATSVFYARHRRHQHDRRRPARRMDRQGRREAPVRPSRTGLLAPATAVARLLHRREGGPRDDADDERHRGTAASSSKTAS